MADILPFAKPKDREGKVTLSTAERKVKLDALCRSQKCRCAICGCRMTREYGKFHTATLDHKECQPAGCKKRDNDDNLQAVCWRCNYQKGSKRL